MNAYISGLAISTRMRGIGVYSPCKKNSHRVCTNIRSGPGTKWVGPNPPKPTRGLATADRPTAKMQM